MVKTRRVEKHIVEREQYLTYTAKSGRHYESLDMAQWGGDSFTILIYDPGEERESRRLEFETIEQLAGYMQILSGDLRKWKVWQPASIPNSALKQYVDNGEHGYEVDGLGWIPNNVVPWDNQDEEERS